MQTRDPLVDLTKSPHFEPSFSAGDLRRKLNPLQSSHKPEGLKTTHGSDYPIHWDQPSYGAKKEYQPAQLFGQGLTEM